VLPAQFAADPQLRERFDREARVISSLSHPQIGTLFDVGHELDTDFLVLEYLEGEMLADRLGSRPDGLPSRDALEIAMQIADALDRAHRAVIVRKCRLVAGRIADRVSVVASTRARHLRQGRERSGRRRACC
jgi:serine/threonine protein kinase